MGRITGNFWSLLQIRSIVSAFFLMTILLSALIPGLVASAQESGPFTTATNDTSIFRNESEIPSEANLTVPAEMNDTGTGISTVEELDENQTFAEQPLITAAPTLDPRQPVPSTLALERGCEPGTLSRVDPQWVPVNPGDFPFIAEGIVRTSKVTHEDWPFNHKSHDHNFDVALDPAYTGLHSDANKVVNGERLMEMEWEIGYANYGPTDRFPKEFWPWPGDRVWMAGRWVFDCGHYNVHFRPGEVFRIDGFTTEIHPPSAVAFTRSEPVYFSGDRTPSPASKTYIYIHGRGGYYDTSVGGRNYDYKIDIPLPPKPSPTSELRTEVLEKPFGGPSPIIIPKLAENKVQIIYPVGSIPSSPNNKFGAIVASGWREPVSTQAYRVFKITFDSIRINENHEGFGHGDGEFKHLWVGVNGKWLELAGPSGYFGLDDAGGGETYSFRDRSVVIIVPESSGLLLESTGWESDNIDDVFGSSLWSGNPFDFDNNDPIGVISKFYNSQSNFGIGLHDEPSLRFKEDDTNRDFNLRYNIEEVRRFPTGIRTIPTDSGFFIQSSFGRNGNFDLVVPRSDSGFNYFWRDNDSPSLSWHGPIPIATHAGKIDALSLVQTSFGTPGSFDVVARIGDRLAHFWREPGPPFTWHGPFFLPGAGFSGNPALIQSLFGSKGNFELVVPRTEGGIAYFWREDIPPFTWHGPIVFGTNAGKIDGVSLIQSNFRSKGAFGIQGVGNLEVAARIGDRLALFWREDRPPFTWHGPFFIPSGTIFGTSPKNSGYPSLIQSNFGNKGNFELVVPRSDAGFNFYWRDNDSPSLSWHGPFVFGKDAGRMDTNSLIQSSFGERGNFEIVATKGNQVTFFWREERPTFTWRGPINIYNPQ